MESKIFQNNLQLFLERFPGFNKRLRSLSADRVEIAASADGGYCYALLSDENQWVPFTNPHNPISDSQTGIDRMQGRLTKGLSPAVVVGLYPGYALETVFQHFKSRLKHHEPFRLIYVIIDSTPCLIGWLKAADRLEILSQSEVEFLWHEDIGEIVRRCKEDESRSHLFIPVSELPENQVNQLISPLATLYLRRQEETERWQKENEQYYEQLDNETLISIIQGKSERKPRLLMPTHSSSTVVQYSTRDTCFAFEEIGWETEILKLDYDLSPWRLVKTIHEFKPDVLLFINHLRTEDKSFDCYPRNLMFITWIQDSMRTINRRDSSEKWSEAALSQGQTGSGVRQRDLIVGYTGIIEPYGYPTERLVPLKMIVNSNLFHPRELNVKQHSEYECEVCFASNRGKPSEVIIDENLSPSLNSFGFTKDILLNIHDDLWLIYRDGKTITTYHELKNILLESQGFSNIYLGLDIDDKNNVIEMIFWQLNDVIYRHVILEWCDELGLNLNLYGKGWNRHPRFGKYAKGEVKHGEELSKAYRCAKYCLHLNSMEGQHQRLFEIISSRAVPITRDSNKTDYDELLYSVLRKVFINYKRLFNSNSPESNFITLNDDERNRFTDYVFEYVHSHFIYNKGVAPSIKKIFDEMLEYIFNHSERLIENGESLCFKSKSDFARLFQNCTPNNESDSFNLINEFNNVKLIESLENGMLNLLGRPSLEDGNESMLHDMINKHLNIEIKKLIGYSEILYGISYNGIMDSKRLIETYESVENPPLNYKYRTAQALYNLKKPDIISEIIKDIDIETLPLQMRYACLPFFAQKQDFDNYLKLIRHICEHANKLTDSLLSSLISNLLRIGEKTQAERFIHKIPLETEYKDIIINYTNILIWLWKFDDALAYLESKKSFLDKNTYHITLLTILYKLNRFDEIEYILDHSVGNINNSSAKQRFIFFRGLLFSSLNDFDNALICYEKANDLNYNFGIVFEFLNLLRFLKRYDEASDFIGNNLKESFIETPLSILVELIGFEENNLKPDMNFSANCMKTLKKYYCQDKLAIWGYLIVASHSYRNGAREEALGIMEGNILDSMAVNPQMAIELKKNIKIKEEWLDENFAKKLSEAFFPFNKPDSFERKWIYKETLGLFNK